MASTSDKTSPASFDDVFENLWLKNIPIVDFHLLLLNSVTMTIYTGIINNNFKTPNAIPLQHLNTMVS